MERTVSRSIYESNGPTKQLLQTNTDTTMLFHLLGEPPYLPLSAYTEPMYFLRTLLEVTSQSWMYLCIMKYVYMCH